MDSWEITLLKPMSPFKQGETYIVEQAAKVVALHSLCIFCNQGKIIELTLTKVHVEECMRFFSWNTFIQENMRQRFFYQEQHYTFLDIIKYSFGWATRFTTGTKVSWPLRLATSLVTWVWISIFQEWVSVVDCVVCVVNWFHLFEESSSVVLLRAAGCSVSAWK